MMLFRTKREYSSLILNFLINHSLLTKYNQTLNKCFGAWTIEITIKTLVESFKDGVNHLK